MNPYNGCSDHYHGGRGPLSAYRRLCVTEDGKSIKFVDVSTSKHWFHSNPMNYRDDAAAIVSWTMASGSFVWVEDGRLERDDFLALAKQHNLPSSQLEFPLVDMKDRQTIYFVLTEEFCFFGKTNIIMVDMVSREITSVTPYMFGSFKYCEGDIDSFTTSCNLFYNAPFLPCEFPKHLSTCSSAL